jgi:hypothetical protein
MGRDFTSGMAHAFIASVLICAVAIVFSVVREGRRLRPAASAQPQAAQLTQPATASADLGLRIARK